MPLEERHVSVIAVLLHLTRWIILFLSASARLRVCACVYVCMYTLEGVAHSQSPRHAIKDNNRFALLEITQLPLIFLPLPSPSRRPLLRFHPTSSSSCSSPFSPFSPSSSSSSSSSSSFCGFQSRCSLFSEKAIYTDDSMWLLPVDSLNGSIRFPFHLIHINICPQTHTHTRTHIYTFLCVCVCMYVYIYIYVFNCM